MKETLKNYVCEICGGELKEIGEGHFQCPYCRAEFFKETTLPDELILDLHSANRARSLQRFEDALNEYDRIISAYPTCFDAYWGATLSDYGIQYEKDYDGRMIPTVHRFSETSVFENKYYTNAVNYCKNEKELERIKNSAEEIERIRAEIKKTVGTQEPYDIFLCYKETPIGNPKDYTPEFYWAVDLYGKLMGLGYRVFFAKQSLPASKGDYEAHIFPALSSAKLMLILTTSVEHVESVWVKNEWSRFIRFAKEDPTAGKRFKVIMRGFKPEELPRELRKEQVLNQDSLEWANQLYAVIEDTFRDKKKEEEERRRRESEEQAARFAKMLEEERKRWAAEEQKKQEEEQKAKREEEERKKKEEEERRKRIADEIEAGRARISDERIKELERKLEEERKKNAASGVTSPSSASPTVSDLTSAVSASNAQAPISPTLSTPTAGKVGQTPASQIISQESPVSLSEAESGKRVVFGSYPQERVTDNTLIQTLNGLVGKLPTKSNSNAWTVYKYFGDKSGSTPKLMWFIDVNHGGERYRGVYFVAYRSFQSFTQRDNRYEVNNVYWFRYQPISWRVLEKKTGKALLFSEKLVDSQLYFHTDSNRKAGTATVYANNYEKSDIRAWLNESFFLTAFNTEESEKIEVTAVSNTAQTTGAAKNQFALGSTKDKVFLLSLKDTTNTDYGFSDDALARDKAREKRLTDYALCQGAMSFSGVGRWWTRSPNASSGDRALYVDGNGFAGSANLVDDASLGICPALWVSLDGKAKKNTAVAEDNASSTTDGKTEKPKKTAAENRKEPKVGDVIKFGKYTQSSTSATAKVIEWQVLDKQDGKALVISKRALDGRKYNETVESVTWETCSLRAWLNTEFLDKAFSAEERAAIPTVTVSADKNPSFDTPPGNKTEDKVFLLSINEANKYFNKKTASCMPSSYAKAKGLTAGIDGECCWWLRTPGTNKSHFSFVDRCYGIHEPGKELISSKLAVRPAMWIDLNAITQDDKKSSEKPEKSDTNGATYIEKQLKDGFYKGYAINDVPNGKGKLTFNNGSTYEGDFVDGMADGIGTLISADGSISEGQWKKNSRVGNGKITYKNGDVYEGEWFLSDNVVKAKKTFACGDVYEGGFFRYTIHGKGKMVYACGDVYEGGWRFGEKNGMGKLTLANGTVKEGEFVNDRFRKRIDLSASEKNTPSPTAASKPTEALTPVKAASEDKAPLSAAAPESSQNSTDSQRKCISQWIKEGHYTGWVIGNVPNGIGELKYTDGCIYTGSFVNGKREGKGKMIYSKTGRIHFPAEGEQISGDVYEGEWKNNIRHGQGKMTFENGEVYEGQWTDDRRTGKGKMTYNTYDGVYEGEWFKDVWSGMGKFSSQAGVYEGMFQNGTYSGNGKMTYSDGTVYEGNWVNGKKEGIGKETNRLSNTTYEGEWKNGFRDGKGKLTFYNGSFYEGEWEQNSFKGKGKMTYKDGKVEKGRFVNGVFKKTLF